MADPPQKVYPVEASGYTLLEEIGQGVSAIVYRAKCIMYDEIVAIKSLDLERCNSTLDEIRREAATMSLISHSTVIKAHCSFVVDQNLWVIMPFMSGGSCLHIMKSAFPDGFEEAVIASILKESLRALEYLHRHGHIHRDVKAGNILVDASGVVKLADFGVSAFMFDMGDRQRSRQTFVGTPCWMAPEVMEQIHGYDFKADIWSFGITALELAHGHAPFSKYPPMKVLLMTLQNAPPGLDQERDKHRFSKAFKEMIAMCLVKDPAKRPPAEKLLKHAFFKHSKPPEYIVKHVLAGLPDLGERVRILKAKEAARLAAQKMPMEDQEAKSQNAYKRGVSSWNFDVEDLKAQAAAMEVEDEAEDDSLSGRIRSRVPSDQDQQPEAAAAAATTSPPHTHTHTHTQTNSQPAATVAEVPSTATASAAATITTTAAATILTTAAAATTTTTTATAATVTSVRPRPLPDPTNSSPVPEPALLNRPINNNNNSNSSTASNASNSSNGYARSAPMPVVVPRKEPRHIGRFDVFEGDVADSPDFRMGEYYMRQHQRDPNRQRSASGPLDAQRVLAGAGIVGLTGAGTATTGIMGAGLHEQHPAVGGGGGGGGGEMVRGGGGSAANLALFQRMSQADEIVVMGGAARGVPVYDRAASDRYVGMTTNSSELRGASGAGGGGGGVFKAATGPLLLSSNSNAVTFGEELRLDRDSGNSSREQQQQLRTGGAAAAGPSAASTRIAGLGPAAAGVGGGAGAGGPGAGGAGGPGGGSVAAGTGTSGSGVPAGQAAAGATGGGGGGGAEDQRPKAVPYVQKKGRFSVTSEDVEFEEDVPTARIIQGPRQASVAKSASSADVAGERRSSGGPGSSTPNNSSPPTSVAVSALVPHLQNIMQHAQVTQDTVLMLLNSITPSDVCNAALRVSRSQLMSRTGSHNSSDNIMVECMSSATLTSLDRERDLLQQISELQSRLNGVTEEMQHLKLRNVQLERQLNAIYNEEEERRIQAEEKQRHAEL